MAAATATAGAQDAPRPPDAGVQSLVPVFVTARPGGSELFELADPVNVLQGRELLLRQQSTLGATLEQQVGVTATNFGPNASRPVIRGFGSFDVRLLNNGMGLLDASAASPDHAVAVSPFAVERIEVVRGPATVLYGGGALGGVVNSIDSRIATRPPEQSVSGSAAYRYDGQNALSAGGARLDGGTERFALHGDFYASSNGLLRIPGAAWTPAVQTDRGSAGPSGRLPNSQGDTQTAGLGATAFLPGGSYVGASVSTFDTDYGTVAEPDVTIQLRQQTWNLASEWRDALPGLQALRVKAAYGTYTHTEFEGATPGTVFDSRGWNLRVEGSHRPAGPFNGVIGVDAGEVDFSATGEEAFVPTTLTRSVAAFAFEELKRGAWKFSFGGRVERVGVDAAEFAAAGAPAARAAFTPWSVAADAFVAFGGDWGVGAAIERTQRAPSSQELFADGPHLATAQFEIGNPRLGVAQATAFDVALKRRGDGVTGTLSFFLTDFSSFIGLFPSGIWRNPQDRSVAPGPQPIIDPATGETVTPLQQFNYAQVPARFYGGELQIEVPLLRAAHAVSLLLQGDYVNATDRTTGQPLPFIPPLRLGATLQWRTGRWSAAVGALHAAAQDRVPEFQTPTPAYTNVFAHATARFEWGERGALEVFVQATNLLDETIRYSTSPLKDIAPAGARALQAGLRGVF
jgi:iron complex outermembrane receptor protein